MIDNVYELKQRFVGFNKVKLLTVVFYCMTYSWCSCLNEYNASEEKNKGKWTVEGDAIVYEGDGFTVKYRWNDDFKKFIDQDIMNANNNVRPEGYERASRLVGLLYRYQDILGIEVDDEVEYEKVDDKELPGCCKFCCKGKLGDETLLRKSTRKKKKLGKRIFSIILRMNDPSVKAQKQWMGDVGEILRSLSVKVHYKFALVVIANLFDQGVVKNNGQGDLILSSSVQELIHASHCYTNVPFDDYITLVGVIEVTREDKGEK